MTAADIDQRPAELLQHLIRFDTTNPPGDGLDFETLIMEPMRGFNGCNALAITLFADKKEAM